MGELGKELESSEKKANGRPAPDDYEAFLSSCALRYMQIQDDGKLIKHQPLIASLLGYPKGKFPERNLLKLVHSAEKDRLQHALKSHEKTHSMRTEFRCLAENGDSKWLQLEGVWSPSTNTWLTTCEDITHTKVTKQQLINAEQRLLFHSQNTPLGVIEWDPKFRCTRWSIQTEKIFGWKASEVMGLIPSPRTWEIIHEDDLDRVGGVIERLKLGVDPRNECRNRNYRKDGTVITCHWYNSVLFDDNGELISILSLVQDVSEEVKLGTTLQETHDQYRTLFDTTPMGVALCDTGGKIKLANSSLVKMLSAPSQVELLGTEMGFITGVELPPPTETSQSFECSRCLRSDGTFFPAEVRVTAVQVAEKEMQLILMSDLTERRELESERLKSSKLDALGVLAGGIAHDFNNIMTSILGNLDLAENSHDTQAYHNCLESARKSAQKASELSQRLVTFARGGCPIKEAVPLIPIIRDAFRRKFKGSDWKARYSMPPGLWPVEADTKQLKQVFECLAQNSLESGADLKEVKIRAMNVNHPTEIVSRPFPDLSPGPYVFIEVEDMGLGISESQAEKIFDPYYTTRTGHMGLGLATSHSIIKRHHGKVWYQQKDTAGLLIQMLIPADITRIHHSKGNSSHAPQTKETPKGKILCVDDDHAILNILSKLLKHKGYEAVTCPEGAEAHQLYVEAQTMGKPFQLVIIDGTIPSGLGGEAALALFKESDPDVCAIICSGYVDSLVMSDHEAYGFAGKLAKPFGAKQLYQAVESFITIL